MTSIKIPTDDMGVRGLKADNKQPVTSSPVLPVKASNPVLPSPENTQLKNSQSNQRSTQAIQTEQKVLEKRHHNRRKTDAPLILDTRVPHERRKNVGLLNSDKKNHTENDDAVKTKSSSNKHQIDETV